MSLLFYLLLLQLLLFPSLSVHCPIPKHQQTRLFSDLIAITTDHSKSKALQFEYNFEESFHELPSVAFGLNQFIHEAWPIIEIKVIHLKTEKSALSFQVQSTSQSHWESLKISFISTTRSDIQFGTASLQKQSSSEKFQLSYSLEKSFKGLGIKVKPFIQGFKIESRDKQSVGVKLNDVDVEGEKIYFSFINPDRVSLVRSLVLCVIAFNIYTPGVLYVDGIFEQKFTKPMTEIQLPRHGIEELRIYIVGVNSFQASVSQQISLSSDIDESFTLTIGPLNPSEIEFLSVSYLILSVIDCGSCEGNPVLFEGNCSSMCPLGFGEKNGKCERILCSKGYVVKGGRCVPDCPQNEEYVENKCVCVAGFYSINGKCLKCPEGTSYNSRIKVCQSICGNNAIYEKGRCLCNPGYDEINNRCQFCPKGTKYNSQIKKCESACSENEEFNGQICVCKNGLNRINGICGGCPPQSIFNSLFNRCECLNGRQWIKSQNKCVMVCSEYEQLINGDECICKNRLVRIQGLCGVCPKNSYYLKQEQKCFCNYGFRQVNGQCLCLEEQKFDESSQKCVKLCPHRNQKWINGRCNCGEGESRDQNGYCYPPCNALEIRINGNCQCIKGYHKNLYGSCVLIKCPPNHEWDEERKQCRSVCLGQNQHLVNGRCVCRPGFQRQIINGICQQSCPSNKVRLNGVCKCSPGNQIVNGVCTYCPKFTSYVNGLCLCYDGKPAVNGRCSGVSCPDPNHVYDPITGSCDCRPPLVWMRGRCEYVQGCGPNQYWCGKCVCHYGFTRVNGVCVRATSPVPECPPNSRFDPVSYRCVCIDGYYPISEYVCQKCSNDAYWDGHKCNKGVANRCAQGFHWNGNFCEKDISGICGQNQYYSPDGHCICKTGYFWINNQCQKCPAGAFFDGLGCVYYQIRQCNDGYKFWNGQACVCLPDFFEYQNQCVQCPPNTVWNGYCCNPITNNAVPPNVINVY